MALRGDKFLVADTGGDRVVVLAAISHELLCVFGEHRRGEPAAACGHGRGGGAAICAAAGGRAYLGLRAVWQAAARHRRQQG